MTISDGSINHDPTGVMSIILRGKGLAAACRRLTSAVLRRWPLITSSKLPASLHDAT